MKYALVVFETEESRRMIATNREEHRRAYLEWIAAVAASGKLVGGDALETEQAVPVVVRRVNGAMVAGEGTVTGGSETVGGWFIVEVDSAAEAIELACAIATPEAIEVRPVLESAADV
ncbi:YciI family protein [Nocardia wallacei]|uniref:YciI family protein n=1 Tax=Nocardia wallacei TaxID=480035 RepID=UPI0024562BF1|nr:YciI family protein [Nocardia wallacei]